MSIGHAAQGQVGPLAPFTSWVPQVSSEAGGHVWFTPHGPAIVAQSTCKEASVEVVDHLHDFIDSLIEGGLPARVAELVLVLDFRSIERVRPAAAERYLSRSKRRGRPLVSQAHRTYLVTSASPVATMVMRTAAIAIRSVTRTADVHFINDPHPALARHGIAAPPANFLSSWLAQGAKGATGAGSADTVPRKASPTA